MECILGSHANFFVFNAFYACVPNFFTIRVHLNQTWVNSKMLKSQIGLTAKEQFCFSKAYICRNIKMYWSTGERNPSGFKRGASDIWERERGGVTGSRWARSTDRHGGSREAEAADPPRAAQGCQDRLRGYSGRC